MCYNLIQWGVYMKLDLLTKKEVLEKLHNNFFKHGYLENKITDEHEKLNILYSTFGKDFNKDLLIEGFTTYMADDILVLNYDTTNYEKRKNTKNIVLIKDGIPKFKMEHSIIYNFDNDDDTYEEENFYTYGDEKGFIESKLSIKNTCIDSTKITTILTLNRRVSTIREYSRHKYDFYYDNDDLVFVKIRDNMYSATELKYNQRLENISDKINNISKIISNKLDSVLGIDNVKVYKVKRKQID